MQGLMMDVPLLQSQLLDYAAECHPTKEVVSRELDGRIERMTYPEIRTRCRKLAQALKRLGLKEGERLGVLAWNTRAYFELFYGVPGMGGVIHTINPRLYEDQLVYIVNHAEDAWLAFDAADADLVRAIAPKLETVRGFIFMGPREDLPDDLAALPDLRFHEEMIAAEDGDHDWPEFDERRASIICYTSGTTGNPKGVVYSHRAIVLTCLMMTGGDVISGYRSGVGEVFLPFAPLFHGAGWLTPFTAPLMGAKLVLPGRDFTPEALYELLEGEKVSICFGVPTIWMIVVNWMEDHGKRFSTLRATVMSGAKPPRALQAKLLALGVEPMQGWGMTETLGSSRFSLPDGLADATDEAKLDRFQFAGRRTFATRYRIVDDDGNDLPFDGVSRGHLLVRGPVVASGYLKVGEGEGGRPGAEHDWLHTGDIAVMHPDGHIEIADRSKDVIKSGGEWISSVELENAAMGHPEIAEAAVIAVAHPKWQERPLLVCARRAGSRVTGAEVIDHLRDKVAGWWLPDAVEFMDELPRTGTGKIWKLRIRERFEGYALPGTAAGAGAAE